MPDAETRLSDREVDLIAARLAERLGAAPRAHSAVTAEH